MPKGPKGQKRPADVIGSAVRVKFQTEALPICETEKPGTR